MAKPPITFSRLCLIAAILALGGWLIPKVYDQAPGAAGAHMGSIPGDAVYVGGPRAKAPWGDVWVQVRRQDLEPDTFRLEVYSGTTGERLSQCDLKAEAGMPLTLDPRQLAASGLHSLSYPSPGGGMVTLRLSAGTWPFADPK